MVRSIHTQASQDFHKIRTIVSEVTGLTNTPKLKVATNPMFVATRSAMHVIHDRTKLQKIQERMAAEIPNAEDRFPVMIARYQGHSGPVQALHILNKATWGDIGSN